ncbi:MAG: sodium:solute symporter [Lentisphaerae bacterium RIFOXYB12_FULL_65_16]|nr:MAG: sodium:solute symporter [Lentisphaerae bacterium RIFOXYA12_64_32]OGV95094.1 MAG: sodium:solute symporter [Lentisphaerae bacterium RIFOXYB12_FULL_65_16]
MSHFTWVDGSIVGMYLLITMIAGIAVRKYVGKVEHFLVAGREMNVFLGIASLAATEFGIVTCMYTAQAGYTRGFAGAIPGICNAIAMFVVGWTGFCVKPLRDSGVMTIPELFEQHYGKFVRWLAGVVIVLGGLLNMGVFLRVGGQFLVVCCGMNLRYLELAMTTLLVGVAVYTILGGMLSVLVTDYLQFIVMSVGLIVVTFLVLGQVGWGTLVGTVQTHYGAGGFNPFITPSLGWPFVLSNLLTNTAAVLTWQTCIARLLAAKDTRTGRKVYTGTAFFFVCRWVIPGIWGIAALAMVEPAVVQSIGLQFGEKDGSLFAMPYMLSQLVPAGMMGLLVAAMLAADMSTDSSYMLTWGSVIYNDILAPFRKTPWPEKKGLLWNRCIVALIGVFLLFWGLWYKLEGNLWEYLQTTGTIYLASMSTLLIACCYWKRANDWGAIAAIVVGAALPVLSLSLNLFVQVPVLDAAGQQVIQEGKALTEGLAKHYIGDNFVNIGTFALVAVAMVVGSLLKPQPKSSSRPAA